MPLAMTAHVVYTALDPEQPATTSRVVMEEIIRGHIGYDGLVMTDDLSMQALSGLLPGAGRRLPSRPAATWPSTATAAWRR